MLSIGRSRVEEAKMEKLDETMMAGYTKLHMS